MAGLPVLTKFAKVVESISADDLDEMVNIHSRLEDNGGLRSKFEIYSNDINVSAKERDISSPDSNLESQKLTTGFDLEDDTPLLPADACLSENYEDLEEHIIGVTRSEMVQQLVDSVFQYFSLTSINVDFFGEFAKNMRPIGYHIQTIGKHSFFIKERGAVSLASLLTFMDSVRCAMGDKREISRPLTYQRNVEGAVMCALIVTELELKEIMKAFPDYQFGYSKLYKNVEDIRLSIKH